MLNTRFSESATAPSSQASPWALVSVALALLLSSLGTSSANVALPTLATALGVSFQEVQWVVLAYLLVITTLIVSVGRLGDMVGRRHLLLAGVLLFVLASGVCSVAANLAWLLAGRALQGAGAAVMMALTMAFVGDIVAKDKMGRAMGLLGTMSAVGTALGPSLGGVLIALWGWQAIFVLNIPLGLLAWWLGRRFLPLDKPLLRGQAAPFDYGGFDYSGTLLLAGTLGAYALAMTVGRGQWGVLNAALLGAAALGLVAFVVNQSRKPAPLLSLNMFRTPALAVGMGVNAMVSVVMMATLVVGPFYLARGLGLDTAWVGGVMAVGPMISACTGVLAGRVVDQCGAHRAVQWGLAVMALGAAALALLPLWWGWVGYVAAMVLLTPAYQLFQAANNTATMHGIRAEQRGVVSGLLQLSRNLGLITGAAAMGAIFAYAVATDMEHASAPAVAAGLQTTFGVATGLLCLAWVLARYGRNFHEMRQ